MERCAICDAVLVGGDRAETNGLCKTCEAKHRYQGGRGRYW